MSALPAFPLCVWTRKIFENPLSILQKSSDIRIWRTPSSPVRKKSEMGNPPRYTDFGVFDVKPIILNTIPVHIHIGRDQNRNSKVHPGQHTEMIDISSVWSVFVLQEELRHLLVDLRSPWGSQHYLALCLKKYK